MEGPRPHRGHDPDPLRHRRVLGEQALDLSCLRPAQPLRRLFGDAGARGHGPPHQRAPVPRPGRNHVLRSVRVPGRRFANPRTHVPRSSLDHLDRAGGVAKGSQLFVNVPHRVPQPRPPRRDSRDPEVPPPFYGVPSARRPQRSCRSVPWAHCHPARSARSPGADGRPPGRLFRRSSGTRSRDARGDASGRSPARRRRRRRCSRTRRSARARADPRPWRLTRRQSA